MAEEELELDVTQSKGSKTTTILLIILIVLVLIIGGIGAWLLLGKDDAGESSASGGKETASLAPLQYLTLVPEFIVNFGPGSKVRYLQVDLQVATREESALKTVGTYRPVIRNDILVILSGQTFDQLRSRNGKEALQKKLLDTINKVVTTAGKAPAETEENADEANTAEQEPAAKEEAITGPIENVYFTSFIMQ